MGKDQIKIPDEPSAEYLRLLDEYFASDRYKTLVAEIDEWDKLLDKAVALDLPMPRAYPMPKWLADEIIDFINPSTDAEKRELRELADELDKLDEAEGGESDE